MYSLAVNWIGVIVATVAAMIIGMVWYNPKVFGKIWAKQTGVDMQKNMKDGMAKAMLPALIASFITAFVLAVVIKNIQTVTVTHAVEDAVLVWAGFALSYQIVRMAFEGTAMEFFLEEIAHHLVAFVVMAVLIVVA